MAEYGPVAYNDRVSRATAREAPKINEPTSVPCLPAPGCFALPRSVDHKFGRTRHERRKNVGGDPRRTRTAAGRMESRGYRSLHEGLLALRGIELRGERRHHPWLDARAEPLPRALSRCAGHGPSRFHGS